MSLVIFVVLLAIILCAKLSDYSAAYDSKRESEERINTVEQFHNQYGDKALEEDLIEARFYDEKLAPKVIEELGKALKETPGLEDLDPKGLVFFGRISFLQTGGISVRMHLNTGMTIIMIPSDTKAIWTI